jgi:toxin ParE1/3/4
MRRAQLTDAAVADLDEIAARITEADPATAKRLLLRLHTKCSLLAKLPRLGRARDDIRPGIRHFPEGPFVIYYRVQPDGIEVLRILRGARNAKRLLK